MLFRKATHLFRKIVNASRLDGPIEFIEITPPQLSDNNESIERAIDHDASIGISHLERDFIWSSSDSVDRPDRTDATPTADTDLILPTPPRMSHDFL